MDRGRLRKWPEFEQVEAEPPSPQEQGPVGRPLFVEVRVEDGVPRWLKISAAVAVVVGALLGGLALLNGGGSTERDCKTIAGGIVVCGDVNIQQ